MKIGLFGGTFNPIHNAHIYLAQSCCKELGLDQVIFMPTYTPPHKESLDLALGIDRLAMCRLAVAEYPFFTVSDYEVKKEGKSYTYETLAHLHKVYPEWEFYLLMGSDMFLTMEEWKEPRLIYSLATLCVMARQEEDEALVKKQQRLLKEKGAVSEIIKVTPRPMSSTQVRSKIRKGEDVSLYLHPKVIEYIAQNNLYRECSHGLL